MPYMQIPYESRQVFIQNAEDRRAMERGFQYTGRAWRNASGARKVAAVTSLCAYLAFVYVGTCLTGTNYSDSSDSSDSSDFTGCALAAVAGLTCCVAAVFASCIICKESDNRSGYQQFDP